MPRLLAWLLGRDRSKYGCSANVPYRLVCACGQVVSGLRRAHFQVVHCPACRAELFVLPASPLPRVQGVPGAEAQAVAAPGPRRRGRRLALAVLGLAALLGGGVLAVALWVSSALRPTADPAQSSAQTAPPRPGLRQAEQLLARGQFHQALAACDAALASGAGSPFRERRALTQVRRQAALLADLSAESVEEILRHAAGLSPAEWAATFLHRYRGKALVLDTEVARTADGRYRHGWRVFPAEGEARLELDGLQVLEAVPLEQPQRLVLGFRLQGARREPPGVWVVRAEPDSGVLLIDPEAAALCCPELADEASRKVLRRQRAWVLGEGQ